MVSSQLPFTNFYNSETIKNKNKNMALKKYLPYFDFFILL